MALALDVNVDHEHCPHYREACGMCGEIVVKNTVFAMLMFILIQGQRRYSARVSVYCTGKSLLQIARKPAKYVRGSGWSKHSCSEVEVVASWEGTRVNTGTGWMLVFMRATRVQDAQNIIRAYSVSLSVRSYIF